MALGTSQGRNWAIRGASPWNGNWPLPRVTDGGRRGILRKSSLDRKRHVTCNATLPTKRGKHLLYRELATFTLLEEIRKRKKCIPACIEREKLEAYQGSNDTEFFSLFLDN